MFTTCPSAANKHTGTKFTIELHNRNYKKSISLEDRELISNLGFAGLGETNPAWNDAPTRNGPCLLSLVPTFYTRLFVEVCYGE